MVSIPSGWYVVDEGAEGRDGWKDGGDYWIWKKLMGKKIRVIRGRSKKDQKVRRSADPLNNIIKSLSVTVEKMVVLRIFGGVVQYHPKFWKV